MKDDERSVYLWNTARKRCDGRGREEMLVVECQPRRRVERRRVREIYFGGKITDDERGMRL